MGDLRKKFGAILCLLLIGTFILAPMSCIQSKADSMLTLTDEEKEYIQSSGTIRVGQIRNRYPISNLDKKTGELSGINEDMLDLLSSISGLKWVNHFFRGIATT